MEKLCVVYVCFHLVIWTVTLPNKRIKIPHETLIKQLYGTEHVMSKFRGGTFHEFISHKTSW